MGAFDFLSFIAKYKFGESGGSGSGGGVTSWNDLTDRPFGEVKETIIPQGEYVFEYIDGSGACMFPYSANLQVGDTASVHWDGTEYVTYISAVYGQIMLGNLAIVGADDTGEPFCAIVTGDGLVVLDLVATETVTRSISVTATSTKKLDTKYVNAGITVYITDSGSGLKKMTKSFDGADFYTNDEIDVALANNMSLIFRETPNAIIYPLSLKQMVSNANAVCWAATFRDISNDEVYKVYTAEYTPESTASE